MINFEDIISVHCQRLYSLCKFSVEKNNKSTVYNRRFLGRLAMEASWMEETLDAAGARKNEKWFPFREGVSAIKMLSNVAYDVLHVGKSFKSYRLLDSEIDFESEILELEENLYRGILKASWYLIRRAKSCGLHKEAVEFSDHDFIDTDFSYTLENNRKLRHISNPGKSLVYLATEFINLKSETTLFNKLSGIKLSEFREYIPDSVSEEKLRLILVRFHNLQSLYDTYLSESDIENADSRLRILRGHISFIYHMLKSATDFIHYYERHIVPRKSALFFKSLIPIPEERFLEIIHKFFFRYFSIYFDNAEKLCHNVIESYAEIGEIKVLIPEYRGFHVRPSSLVSMIINYYGGSVKMIINDKEYDPSTPLELFRVNEEINAIKRRSLFEFLEKEKFLEMDIKELFEILAVRELIVIYDKEYTLESIKESETKPEYIKECIALLLASGKIDIRMEIAVKFIGDKRSLEDIEILAGHSYGEDKYGNNTSLPQKLSYLKR